MPNIDLSILNQRQTPAFYADVFANRPAAGYVGRIFVSTDTFAFYRDNGTGWDLIGGPGTGTITGSGTANTFTIFTGASSIGDSSYLTQSANAINVSSASLILPSNNTVGGTNYGLRQQMATNDFWTIYGNSVGLNQGELVFQVGDDNLPFPTSGNRFRFSNSNIPFGTSTKDLFIIDLDVSYFNTSLGINTDTPTAAFDVHSDANVISQLNQTVATNNSLLAFQNNGTGKWRIGSFYNSGAEDFGIFDVVGAIQPVTVKKTTGQVLIGTSTVGSGKLVVASATGDNGIQIVGATAPSLRIDNAESGPTKRAGFGISTAVNNFIQGSADRDFCMFNGSTTASPILFGIYDAAAVNVQEAARISPARNFLVNTIVDNGNKLQINGSGYFSQSVEATGLFAYVVRGRSSDNYGGIGFYANTGNTRYGYIQSHSSNGGQLNITMDGGGQIIGDSRGLLLQPTSGNVSINTTDFGADGLGIQNQKNVSFVEGSGESYVNVFRQRNSAAGVLAQGLKRSNTGEWASSFSSSVGRSAVVVGYNNGSIAFYSESATTVPNGTDISITPKMLLQNTGNLLLGTSVDAGQKLQVAGSIYSSGQVTYSNGGNIQHLTDTVAASATRTYTISGNVRGFIQILIGVFGNGSGSTSRAIFFGGGDLSSNMPYTEVLRVNGGTTTISAVTTNATTTTFTIQNSFAFNIANVEISVISGTAISNPVITAS